MRFHEKATITLAFALLAVGCFMPTVTVGAIFLLAGAGLTIAFIAGGDSARKPKVPASLPLDEGL